MSVIIGYKDHKIMAMGSDSGIADETKDIIENSGDFKMISVKFGNYSALIGYTGGNIKIINDIRKDSRFNYSSITKDRAIYEIVQSIRRKCTEDIGILLIGCKFGIFKVFLEYNWSIRPIEQKFTAIGSGRNAALGAMHMGMMNYMVPTDCIQGLLNQVAFTLLPV